MCVTQGPSHNDEVTQSHFSACICFTQGPSHDHEGRRVVKCHDDTSNESSSLPLVFIGDNDHDVTKVSAQ